MQNNPRPNADKSGATIKISFGAINRGSITEAEISTLESTAPAVNTGLPQLPVAGPARQQFTSGDTYQNAVSCSGTMKQIGDRIGIQIVDTIHGDTCSFYTSLPRVLVALAAGLTIAAGQDMYVEPATMLGTNVSSGSTIYIGSANGIKEVNPTNVPAGDYVEIHFKQSEA